MGRENPAACRRSGLRTLLNDLLKVEPVNSYRRRSHITNEAERLTVFREEHAGADIPQAVEPLGVGLHLAGSNTPEW